MAARLLLAHSARLRSSVLVARHTLIGASGKQPATTACATTILAAAVPSEAWSRCASYVPNPQPAPWQDRPEESSPDSASTTLALQQQHGGGDHVAAAGLDASRLEVTRKADLSPLPDLDSLVFGRHFADHCLVIDWSREGGWDAPRISPMEMMQLHPAAGVLHYGTSCFEGLKAYKDADGCIRLFRTEKNIARLERSSIRNGLPGFDHRELFKLITEYLKVDERWIPSKFGYSLYLRPCIIGTTPYLGVGPTESAQLFVIASPCGPYYKEGVKAVKLYICEEPVRAWPGGVGSYKLAGNYAPTVPAQTAANALGCSQVLFTLPSREGAIVCECGAMNIFFVFRLSDGTIEVATPFLDGTILPGITRDSVLQICRARDDVKVSERTIRVIELREAAAQGRLVEAFGTGTACNIQPIEELLTGDGDRLRCSASENSPDSSLAVEIKSSLDKIQYGLADDGPFGAWSIPVR